MADEKRVDQPTGTQTVGHEWDGIEELDTPMPRWWLWTFYLTIVFSIGYVVAYPAWPLLDKGTEGVLGWTSRGQLAAEMEREGTRKAPMLAALAGVPRSRSTACSATAPARPAAPVTPTSTTTTGCGAATSSRSSTR